MTTKTVKCPSCGKLVPWNESSPWRPFCSERCRVIDLGGWADESHRIPDAAPQDFTEHPSEEDDPLH